MKTCTGCGLEKPLDDFGKRSASRDGKMERCRDCHNARQRAYWDANREKMNEWQNNWRKRNPEKRQAQRLRYNRTYREQNIVVAREWAKNNPEKRAKIKTAYRARKHSETFYILDREIKHLKASPCAVCGSQGPVDIDHIVPLSKGGRHSVGNLQPLCRSCNTSKSDKFFADWLYRVVPARLSA